MVHVLMHSPADYCQCVCLFMHLGLWSVGRAFIPMRRRMGALLYSLNLSLLVTNLMPSILDTDQYVCCCFFVVFFLNEMLSGVLM